MSDFQASCPMTRQQVVQQYFLEHRARILDVAAFLDRLDRAQQDAAPDFRELAMKKALQILADNQPQRARRILELLSDATTDLPQSAHGMKGAAGAPKAAGGVA